MTRDPYAWVWNEYALELAQDHDYLLGMVRRFTAGDTKIPMPFDTAHRCLDLVRRELRVTRLEVANECAAWFDGSAFNQQNDILHEGSK